MRKSTPLPDRLESVDNPSFIPASSLARALRVVGDVWTILILKEMFLGTTRFQQFHDRLKIPRQTLALRLASLCDDQILYRRPSPKSAERGFRLTAKGLDLYGFVLSVWAWHNRWDEQQSFLPKRLRHDPCGNLLDPIFCCRGCAAPVDPSDVVMKDGEGAGLDPWPAQRGSRQNDLALQKQGGDGAGNVAASIVGDRWSNLIIDAMLRDVQGFQALKREIGISSNILALRLRALEQKELLACRRDSPRIIYVLTDAARDFWPMIQSLYSWGDRWLAGSRGAPSIGVHRCGAINEPYWRCRACGGPLHATNVSVVE